MQQYLNSKFIKFSRYDLSILHLLLMQASKPEDLEITSTRRRGEWLRIDTAEALSELADAHEVHREMEAGRHEGEFSGVVGQRKQNTRHTACRRRIGERIVDTPEDRTWKSKHLQHKQSCI